MLLHLLDTPQHLPQTMAFAVDVAALETLREALRAVEERGHLKPMRALWKQHVGAFKKAWVAARSEVDAGWLRALCDEASRSAVLLGLKAPALKPVLSWLEKRSAVQLSPLIWLELKRHEGLSADVAQFVKAGAAIIGRGRFEALVSTLKAVPKGVVPPPELTGPSGELGWVSALRFRATGVSGPLREKIVDPINDVVEGPAEAELGEWETSASSLFERVRGDVAADQVLALLVGAHVPSEGPGPFLPPPPQSIAMEAAEWRRLPLFVASHWSWPLFQARFLAGGSLGLAAKWVKASEPDRSFHGEPTISAAAWRELVSAHWPRCRDRFVELLTRAEREGRAVVMLDAELSHAFWVGERIPPVLVSAQ
jgi:hypothetical protein